MMKSESIADLAKAMAAAQGEIENASKNAKNPHFRSNYADLAEVINTVRPILSRHGLSITQFPAFEGGIASVESVLMHSSGEWMSGISSSPVNKQDAQGIGSALTYLRRYSLAAIAGIAQEDDDGNGAVGGGRQQQAPQRQAAPQKPKVMDAASVQKAVAACATADRAKLDQIYQYAQKNGATAEQLQEINSALVERISVIGE
jgi:hypothetical protein